MDPIEQAIADLTAMRDDYVEAARRHGDKSALGNYCRGKRDAYSRAVSALTKAQRAMTRWGKIKAVFR